MKSIALLATALFLASAPSPDSETISELSAGFLSTGNENPLQAAEPDRAFLLTQSDGNEIASPARESLDHGSIDSEAEVSTTKDARSRR